MKKSEYQKEINRLNEFSKFLNERLEIQYQTAMWINERSDILTKKIDEYGESLDWQQREQLLKEAEELMGRIFVERKLSENDKELEKKLRQGLDDLSLKISSEGFEE